MAACFRPADILLPDESVDMARWAVIACDQYTSQPQYWSRVETIAGEAPSSYKMIYPEAYIGKRDIQIEEIQHTMHRYVEEGILKNRVRDGFVLTERMVGGLVRAGLVGVIDLEQYEYAGNVSAPVRATEETIVSRIPPRMHMREACLVESPHIMVLLEDKEHRLIEPLYEEKDALKKLYDFELMLGGGHIRGYAVEEKRAEKTADLFARMQAETDGTVLAVGDGNHSLAAAKAYWERISARMKETQKENHPARYALVEVVNLYSPAICFEPIHRILFHGCVQEITELLMREMAEQGHSVTEGSDIVILGGGREKGFGIPGLDVCRQVEVLQKVVDIYVSGHQQTETDYIHGAEHLRELAEKERAFVGILLKPMKKEALFPLIRNGKILPRKAFSMGEAWEKRYYLECRQIRD